MKRFVGEICLETLEPRMQETARPLARCLQWARKALNRVVFLVAEPGESTVEAIEEARVAGFRVLEQNDLPDGESWIALARR